MRWLLAAMLSCFASQAPALTTSFTPGCVTAEPVTSVVDFTGSAAVDPLGIASYSGSVGFNSGTSPCGSDHLAIGTGGSVTISFTQPVEYFGMAWGTKDSFNAVEVFDGATLLLRIGNNGFFDTEYLNVFAGLGESFTSIVLLSAGNFFETDNHSYRLAEVVDTPAPTAMALIGLGAAALVGRRRG
jgi:MYXO-CTERM domain-containing protein